MFTALITTVPFAERDRRPIELLESAGIEYRVNPLGRRLKAEELADLIPDVDVLIAGTEPITAEVLDRANRLKLISRIGIGLDSVDLLAAEARGVQVSYTPDAPAPAVAELAMGLMLSTLRHVHVANLGLHGGAWHRYFGRRLSECTVGLVGAGRIGGRVLRHLVGFEPARVLVNDLVPKPNLGMGLRMEWVDKAQLLRESDVVSLHVPLTAQTRQMICRAELMAMKADAVLINTARGGIVHEGDLAAVLRSGHLAAAAIDVFEEEPYSGALTGIDRCLLTSHMGSMSVDCRTQMEIEATEEAVRFVNREPLRGIVPKAEYDMRRATT
jgi:D-3-phosphoglycerate dehydrogenase